MSLLRDIQVGATEDSVSLSSLLRKVKLLATRLGLKEVSEWATHELSGYSHIDELPPYRGPFEVVVLGNAIGQYGRELRNFPIPPLALNKEYRNSLFFKLHFLHGVAELEALAAAKETLRAPWPADIAMSFPALSRDGMVKTDSSMTWVEIWKSVPYTTVVGVLSDVRTRLLDFSLKLGAEEPSAEREQRLTDPEHAAKIFYTAVNVALGNRDVSQTRNLPVPFDTNGLMSYLRKLGLDDEMLDDLQEALDKDAEEDDEADEGDKPKRPGRRVLSWLKNVSAASTTKIGVPIATALLTQALLHYFKL